MSCLPISKEEMLATLGRKDGLTRGELQRSAANVLKFALTRIQQSA